MKKSFFFLATVITCQSLIAQNVGIGTATPNASAMLEISSTNKGVLLPRVADTSAIITPVKGLIIFSNANNKLWYYDGSRWQQSIGNGGGVDSIWYKASDTVANTAKPYVGINADYILIEPQANLQVNGSLLVQGKMDYSNSNPTAGQSYTMNNTGTMQNINVADSVFRVYDPGGIADYNNNMQGNVYSQVAPYAAGYKISSVAADFGIGAGDTLWIGGYTFPDCRTEYEYRFTNTTINPADFIVAKSAACYFIFRSNADGNNGKGFNFSVKRLYNHLLEKEVNTAGPSLLYNASKNSFAVGNFSVASSNAISMGIFNNASGYGSAAIGYGSVASGNSAIALGQGTATGPNSLATGRVTFASGDNSTALGYNTNASGIYSTAMGYSSIASGAYSTAIGNSEASSTYSMAIGHSTASGDYSTAMGYNTIASGLTSTAMGSETIASIYRSTVLGSFNSSFGTGTNTWVNTDPLFVIGNGTGPGTRSNAMVALKNGNIGIGTNTPTVKLEVNGSDAIINDVTIGIGGGGLSSNTTTGNLALSVNTTGAANTAMGYHALQDNTTADYNSAFGYVALANNTTGYGNTALGYRSLFNNSIGNRNVAIGIRALYNNNYVSDLIAIGDSALYNNNGGTYNVAIGSKALAANIVGDHSTAVGYRALENTTGGFNTAIGSFSLNDNTTGYYNTALGISSLRNNTDGFENTALGMNAINSNPSGNFNTAVGYYALNCMSSGSGNTAIGNSALSSCVTGNNNTLVGYNADMSSSASNSVGLGYNSSITASNQVRIGNSSVSSIGGYAGWTNVSDGRVKKNIQPNVPGLSFINLLIPVTYNLDLDAAENIIQRPAKKDKDGKIIYASSAFDLQSKKGKENIVQSGFVAQDVEKAAQSIGYNFSGVDPAKNEKDLYGLRYAEFVVPLVKAVQELSKQNDDLRKQIDELRNQVNGLHKKN